MKKHAKTIFFGLIILLAVIGYSRYFLCDMPPPPEPEIIVDLWSKPLIDSGYKPVTGNKPVVAGLPDKVRPIMTASGTVRENRTVEITVVESPDKQQWIHATVDGEDVRIERFEYLIERIPNSRNDWSILACGRFSDGLDFGIGASWEPLQFMGARAGVSVIMDINENITQKPDWVAVNARLSRRIGAFSLGADVGYCLGDEQGLNVGVSVGVAIGI